MRIITKEELEDAIQRQKLGSHQPVNPFQGDALRAMRNLAEALFNLGYRETAVENVPKSLRGIFFPE